MLLERDHILEELDGLAAAAVNGAGKVALLTGEAGIGKTSVLRALARRIPEDLRPLWTAFEDVSSPEALTILRDLPEIADDLLDNDDDDSSRIGLFREALARLCKVPTILFVEDLHWADDSSIDFIRYVGRRIDVLPLLLVISSRNEEQQARSRLARTAGDLPPCSRVRIELDHLSSTAVGQLAAAQGQIGSKIHLATNGNPLLVTELLANSGTRSLTMDDLVGERANRLSKEARSFLDFCSIIPRRVAIEQMELIEVAHEHVQECLDSGLLLTDGDGVAFRHELTRHAVEDALGPLKRRQLHALELERLDRAEASPARRLHHAISSGDSRRILELAPIAAEQAARLGAHGEAARAWQAIVDIVGETDDPAPYERYAFELHMIGMLPEAIEWQYRAIDLHEKSGERLRLGDSLRFLSRLRYMNGERELADRAAEEAVAVLEPLGETAELAHAYDTRAQLAMLADRNAEAIRWSELAWPIAERFNRIDLLSTISNNHGTALQYSDYERAVAMLDRSIELGQQSGSQEHIARAHINRTWIYMSRPALADAIMSSEVGIEFCRDHELAAWEQYLRGGRALILFDLGHWTEAMEQAEAAIRHPAATALVRNPSSRVVAKFLLRTGGPGLEAHIDELRQHGARGTERPRHNSFAMVMAEHAWTLGVGQAAALEILRDSYSRGSEDGRPWDASEMWFWSRKLGAEFEVPANITEPFGLLAAGDVEGAANAMQHIEMPFEEALMLIEGDESQAARGLAILETLGAEATAERVRADLQARGIRKGTRGRRASTRSNEFGLTRRELAVLRELDLGLSNKEIGEKLFVSAKTVDHHVSSILAKTATRTRGEAAALARRERLID